MEKEIALWKLNGDPTVLITLAHIFNHFAPLMVKNLPHYHTTEFIYNTDTLLNFAVQSLPGGRCANELYVEHTGGRRLS